MAAHGRQVHGPLALVVRHVDDVGLRQDLTRPPADDVIARQLLNGDRSEERFAAFDMASAGCQVERSVALSIADIESSSGHDEESNYGRMVP